MNEYEKKVSFRIRNLQESKENRHITSGKQLITKAVVQPQDRPHRNKYCHYMSADRIISCSK